jgi:chromatin segregation and condensation protein Rec8/ScpA/Scc1 (kleisin family)
MRVLQLAPLCRRLRERIEEGLVSLDESVDLLVDASYLVFVKAQWLIPQSLPFEEEEVEDDWSEATENFEDSPPLLDGEELAGITGEVERLLKHSQLMFTRGYTAPIDEVGQIDTAAIEVSELAEAMDALVAQMGPRERTVKIIRRNFSDHMRWFWKQVTRLASRYKVLRFSLFRSSNAQDSVLNFLVLLELVKRRRIFARQPNVFGDIMFSTKRDVIDRVQDDGP